MVLVKYKQPVEYSFVVWITNYPESNHPIDDENFYSFVKNVCRYNASKWKNEKFLKSKILKRKPKFNPQKLKELLYLYGHLKKFYNATYLPGTWRMESNTRVSQCHYIERGVKKGVLYQKERIRPLL